MFVLCEGTFWCYGVNGIGSYGVFCCFSCALDMMNRDDLPRA